MSKQERLSSSLNFPEDIEEGLLIKLEEKIPRQTLRVAVAHQIEKEGLFLRDITEKFFPESTERKIAVDEYTMIGTLILETDDALRRGFYEEAPFFPESATSAERQRFLREKQQVDLLKRDPTGFALLRWRTGWLKRWLASDKCGRFSENERKAALIGGQAAVGRYSQLYQTLVKRGLPPDT